MATMRLGAPETRPRAHQLTAEQNVAHLGAGGRARVVKPRGTPVAPAAYYLGTRVSEETVRNSWNAGAGAS
ncbi:MAG: hypothetical protein V7607_3935 [Solirubrobacteraceae bacterium]